MQIFYKELSLQEGFALADLPKNSRIVAGREVSMASGMGLFLSMRNQTIKCWWCSCVADRWIASKGQDDKISKPVLNLFALKQVPATKKQAAHSRIVMMTRDHIIPKSKGGRDVVANLRPGCEDCNSQRGSIMNKADQRFMDKHPELIDPMRAARAAEVAARLAHEADARLARKATNLLGK